MARRQKGLALVMVSYFYLLALLALALSSHLSVLRYTQGIASELTYRQRFWLLEAGLECAFSQLVEQQPDQETIHHFIIDGCLVSSDMTITIEPEVEDISFRLISTIGNHSLQRSITITSELDYRVAWIEGSWSDEG